MLAGVTDCRRSRKWGYRGRLALGFKSRRGGHDKKNHAALGLPLPHSLGSQKARCSSNAELSQQFGRMQERGCGKERGERTFAGGPREGTTQVWIKNWRSQQHSWWCWELREACQWSMDYWEDLGLPEPQTCISFPEIRYPWLAKGGKNDCVCVWVF